MNCDECREKLQQYVEGSLSYETDEKIKQHLLNCPGCSRRYEEEKNEYEMFKEAFQFKEIDFNDSTERIMNSIDKNKYKSKKVFFYRHRKTFGTIAAAVIICVISVPVISSLVNKGNEDPDMFALRESSSGSRNIEIDNEAEKETAKDSSGDGVAITKDNKNSDLTKNETTEEHQDVTFGPNYYTAADTDFEAEPKFNMPYVKTSDGRFEAALEGRGESGIEEGEGIVYVRDMNNKKASIYKSEDERNGYCALNINWFDDSHLMIVHGYEFGTLYNGVELIMLDVETGNQKIIYKADDSIHERIIKAYINEQGILTIEKGRYTDDSLNDFKEEIEVYDGYKLWDVIK